ncbi:glycosyltransferase family 2 protein [Ammoniphilus oxalaticus]|uniref:glycosyltransferase family 2 protein n=1 Tax=Ammoniphilus oxalaticus TaxID=66863 RepID=UPI0011C40A59|nr:glycosyltransferase family A protein [Ammoniphilus oxalaticus]
MSIVIPHYNSVDMLKKLINSIPKQSDVQIIVVDDKSNKDIESLNSLMSDNRYDHVLFLKNETNKKGAGVCRNIGLKKVKGEWVLFADADDFFTDDFYSIVRKYFNSDNDVIFFTPTSIELETGKKSNRHDVYEKKIVDYIQNNNIKSELSLRYEFTVPWSKLIKVNLLKENNICFDEVIASNDMMFSAKVGLYMEKFDVSDKVIYCVTKSKGSLTTKINETIFDTRLMVRINYCQFLKYNLSSKELKMINLSGRGMIYNSIIHGHGLKKVFSTYIKLRRNGIEVFNLKFLNPIFLIKKVSRHYKIYSENKRYLSK